MRLPSGNDLVSVQDMNGDWHTGGWDKVGHPDAASHGARDSIIYWQDGPINEGDGPNGCTLEDVLGLCMSRLRRFNGTPARCRENSIAITKIEEALHWLDARTARRCAEGTEGTYQESGT